MRRRDAVVAVLATAVVALLVGVGLSAYLRPEVTRPSPSPTPIAATPTFTLVPETPSPSPSPTATPTVAATAPPTTRPRTPRPQPTNSAAGDRLIPYYFLARQQFSILPPTPQLEFDFASDLEGDAFFRGLTSVGLPIFTVREDFVMTQRTAYHEIGHAYEELLKRKNASVDWRARYWAFRGFPGTWQQAAAEAAAKPPGMSQWIVQPQESWAEAFSVAMVGGGQEKTLDYGRTINPAATKAFFVSLLNQ